MTNTILINDFDFTEFFAANELVSQEIKGKGVNYPIQIDSVDGPTSLQIKIFVSSYSEMETKEQLIPIKQLLIKDNTIDTEEEIILDSDDLVLIFTAQAGVYYIPINIKNISLIKNGNQETIVSGQAVLTGEVLNVERRRFERIDLKQEVTYFLSSLKYHGIIRDISPVGARLITNQKINGSKVVIDFSFAGISIEKLPGDIIWRRKLEDGKFLYGLNFCFSESAHQAELEKWLSHL